MLLELLTQGVKSFRNTGEECIHPLKIFIFVVVEEVLEVFPHELSVITNQDVFAFGY